MEDVLTKDSSAEGQQGLGCGGQGQGVLHQRQASAPQGGKGVEREGGEEQQQQKQHAEKQEELHPAVLERFSHAVPVPSHPGPQPRLRNAWEDSASFRQQGTTYVWTRCMVHTLAAAVRRRLARYADGEGGRCAAAGSGGESLGGRALQSGVGGAGASGKRKRGSAEEDAGGKEGGGKTSKDSESGELSGVATPKCRRGAGSSEAAVSAGADTDEAGKAGVGMGEGSEEELDSEVQAALGLRTEEQRALQAVLQRLESWGC